VYVDLEVAVIMLSVNIAMRLSWL